MDNRTFIVEFNGVKYEWLESDIEKLMRREDPAYNIPIDGCLISIQGIDMLMTGGFRIGIMLTTFTYKMYSTVSKASFYINDMISKMRDLKLEGVVGSPKDSFCETKSNG